MNNGLRAWLALGGVLLWSVEAQSGAFMLQQQSAKGSGRAFAGEAAIAEDAATIFYNPAGLTELKGSQAQAGAYVMVPRAKISDNGSTRSGVPFVGESDQGFDPQAFGHVYVAAPATQDLWVGLGVTTPFGLANHYDPDFFGRYDSTRVTLQAIDLAPTIAYAIHPKVSIGGGLDIQYLDAKLVNALPVTGSPAMDGLFTLEGSDWSVGFNLGILVKPTDKLRLGLSYRSAMTHDVEGDATTEVLGTKSVQSFSTELKLPDTISLGVAYDLTPSLTLLGQVNRFGWSRLEELRIKLADGSEPTTTENYRDTWGISLGAQYKLAPGWVLRGGVMYDQTPTRDEFRSTVVPDVNRFWATIGASYQFSDTIALDVSYEHLFENDAPINRTNDFSSTLGTVVQTRGTTETSADVFGLTLRMQF